MAHYILTYEHPELGEQRYELAAGRSYRIGSKPDCDIVISLKDVSRHHAILETFERSFQITDLDSKNGTFVNGQQVASHEFRCGDTLNISSVRLDIIEVSSDAFRRLPEVRPTPPVEVAAEDSDDTMQFRAEAGVDEVVELLEIVAAAPGSGAVGVALSWGVTTLGLETAVILYRDDSGRVAVLGSAGDLGRLVVDQRRLGALVATAEEARAEQPHSRRVEEVGEGMLVAPLSGGHVLVLGFSGPFPAVSDIRALMAAVEIVLGSGRGRRAAAESAGANSSIGVANAAPGPGREPSHHLEEKSLLELPLEEARSEFERWMVSRILAECGGNQSRAARRLGISRAGLFKKLKKLGLR